jgi:hypothetical protein
MAPITREKLADTLFELMNWSDPEWAKNTGITRQTFWRLRKDNFKGIEAKTLELMASAANRSLSWSDKAKTEAELIDKLKQKDNEMNESQLARFAENQQRTIELQDEKIQALETTLSIPPIETQIWDAIDADLEFNVSVRLDISTLSVKKKYTRTGDLKPLAEYIGYSTDELREIFTTNKWFNDVVGNASVLYSEGTIDRLKNMSKIVVKSMGLFKLIVGEHYIPIPMTFITINGIRKRAMSYNKLNITSMQGHSKIVFMNGEH